MNSKTNDHGKAAKQPEPDDMLEALFKHASARSKPSEQATREARHKLHRDWQHMVRKRRWVRAATGLAAAATVTIVVLALVRGGGGPGPGNDLTEIARVVRISGSAGVLATEATKTAPLARGMPVYLGQTLVTDRRGGISLELRDGISLRIDQQTKLSLHDEGRVKLLSGRIYADTGYSDAARGREPTLEVLTELGVVRHVGTQYMTRMDAGTLDVVVRSGSVSVAPASGAAATPISAGSGQAISLRSSGDYSLAPAAVHGDAWQWAENLGPGFVLDGRTMAEFLSWAARETGLELSYLTAEAELLAQDTVVHGEVDLPARQALNLMLMTSDLSADIRRGVIEVSFNP